MASQGFRGRVQTAVCGIVFCLGLLGMPGTVNAAVSSGGIVSLHNAARAQQGLAPLSVSGTLNQAAQNKANDMLAKDYFDHDSPDGLTPWHWIKGAGYRYAEAGENLAIDFFDDGSVQSAWMASSGHRANILDGAFTEIGVGIASGDYQGRQTTLVAVMFARPSGTAAPAVANAPSAGAAPATAHNARPYFAAPVLADTVAPAAPVIAEPRSDGFVNSHPFTVRGEAEAGSRVQVSAGATLLGEGIAANGAFAVDVTLDEGVHDLDVVAIDAAGNVGETAKIERLTVDTTAPALAEGIRVSGSLVRDRTFLTRVETTEPAAGLQAFAVIDGERVPMTAVAQHRFEATVLNNAADRQMSVAFAVRDAAGNEQVSEAQTVTVRDAYPFASFVEPERQLAGLAVPDLGAWNLGALMATLAGVGFLGARVSALRRLRYVYAKSLLVISVVGMRWML